MNQDFLIPGQYAHMARAACLVLLHPSKPLFAVCSRRNSDIDGFPGGKQDPGETMAQAAARETQEEIGVQVDVSKLELLFSAAIPGKKDFWVETFITVSPTEDLRQMESGITVKWNDWESFAKNNAFKEYNQGVYRAWQNWSQCQQLGNSYVFDASHLSGEDQENSPGF